MYACSIGIDECYCCEEVGLGVRCGEIVALPFRAFTFVSFSLVEVVSEIRVRAEAGCAYLRILGQHFFWAWGLCVGGAFLSLSSDRQGWYACKEVVYSIFDSGVFPHKPAV